MSLHKNRYVDYYRKKILICGNGPCLGEDLTEVNMHEFDFVLRMNSWQPSEQVGDRCDIWCSSFWKDVREDSFDNSKIVWGIYWLGATDDPPRHREHVFCTERAKKLLGREPDYIIPRHVYTYICSTLGHYPSTGASAVAMARAKEMYITLVGFNFFDQSKPFHYYDSKGVHYHKAGAEKAYVKDLVQKGKIICKSVL